MNIRNDNERLLGAFYGIVRSVLNKDTQFSGSVEAIIEKLPKEPCPDQEVGLVSEIISRAECLCELPYRRKDVRYDVSQNRGDRPRIIIILESPHKDEFSKVGLRPIGPACGCTGCRLARNWEAVFGNRFNDYELVIINAVRFQCSMAAVGEKYKKYKNRIVCACLGDEVLLKDLNARLKKLNFSGAMFVNACTSSAHGKVAKVLQGLNILALDLSHPSSWWCPCDVKKQRKKVDVFIDEHPVPQRKVHRMSIA